MPGSYPGFDLYARMQELAARMAAGGAGADDFAAEWRRMLGAASPNPFASAFQAMGGEGMQGIEAWNAAMTPWLEAARREGGALLGLPAFGIGREHQERTDAARTCEAFHEDSAAQKKDGHHQVHDETGTGSPSAGYQALCGGGLHGRQ